MPYVGVYGVVYSKTSQAKLDFVAVAFRTSLLVQVQLKERASLECIRRLELKSYRFINTAMGSFAAPFKDGGFYVANKRI